MVEGKVIEVPDIGNVEKVILNKGNVDHLAYLDGIREEKRCK